MFHEVGVSALFPDLHNSFSELGVILLDRVRK